MQNSVLPVVRFTDNEVKALFIAFMATRNQQLPYLKSRQSLAEKLLGLISENQQEDLVLLDQILLFEGTNPHNPDLLELSDLPHPMLEQLIQLLLSDCYIWVTVKEEQTLQSYPVYLLHLYNAKSLWLIEAFDLNEEKKRIIPVDLLTGVKPYPGKKRISRKKILEKLNKQEETVNLILELGPQAIARFKKYHPLHLTLSYTNPYQTTAILKTFISVDKPGDVTEIVDWLLFLGEDVSFKEVPGEVWGGLQERFRFYFPSSGR